MAHPARIPLHSEAVFSPLSHLSICHGAGVPQPQTKARVQLVWHTNAFKISQLRGKYAGTVAMAAGI